MTCKHCGAKVGASATYCGHCGRPTNPSVDTRSQGEFERDLLASINRARVADGKSPLKKLPTGNPAPRPYGEALIANPNVGGFNVPQSAINMYRDFWQLEPNKIGAFGAGFKIPAEATLVGAAVHVMYRSRKTDPSNGKVPKRPIDYIHEHSSGVKVCRTDTKKGEIVSIPSFIRDVPALVLLGECLGYAYDDGENEIAAEGTRPLPELYTIPSGRALLVVQSKRTVKAIIWGGSLGVEPRGIVH